MRFELAVGSPLPAAYVVVACTDCGFVYADTPGSPEDYARYYAEFSRYEDPAVATGGGEQDFDRLRLAQTAYWIAEHVPSTSRVLDIGCGNGGLLSALQERGFANIAGMDPSAVCVEVLRERGFEAVRGVVGDTPSGLGRFDLVILSHVLEHLLEPRIAMASLKNLLSPVGRVYMETPDAARYVDFPSVPFYYFDSEHINHFDGFALTNLARVSGFQVTASGSKSLTLMDGRAYPAVFALAANTSGVCAPVADYSARAAVAAYVVQSRKASGVPEVLSTAVATGRPLALWGAGSQAQRLLQLDAMSGANIVAVVDADRKKQGSLFAGQTIVAPATGLIGLPENCLIVIAAALVSEKILADYRALSLPYECVVN